MSPEEIEFFQEVEALTKQVVSPVIEYRLHYNKLGEIIACSMIDHPNLGSYIVVDKTIYEHYFDYCVVDDQLHKIEHDSGYRVKLIKSTRGYWVVKNHAGLVLEPGETFKDTEIYGHTNS